MVTFSDEVYDYNDDPHGPISQIPPTRPNRAVVVEPEMKIPDAIIGIIETAQHPSEYTAINVTFIRHEQWKSYIDVKAFVRETRRNANMPDKDLVVAEFRFDRDCLTNVDIALVGRKELAYMRYKPLKELIINKELWKLTIKYKTTLLHKGSLVKDAFSGRAYPDLERLHRYLRSHEEVQFLIKGGKHVGKQFNTWIEQFQNEEDQLDLWYPGHPGKYFIQENEYPLPDERPVVHLQSTSTFSNVPEYKTILGFGAIQEEEWNKRVVEAINETWANLKLVNVPNSNQKRLFGALKFNGGTMLRLDEGDQLKIRFDPAKDNDRDVWSAVVLKALSFAPVGHQSILLFRPYDKEKETYDDRVLEVIEPTLDTIGKVEDMHALLKDLPPCEVGVKLEYSDKGFRNQIVALEKLSRNPRFHSMAQLLLGLDISSTNEVDIFEGCADISTYLTDATLNQAQGTTIDTFRQVRNNVSLVTGPPGTGKTAVVVTTVICLISGVKEGCDKKRVLVVAPSNGPVDEAAQRIYDKAQLYEETKHKIIVRCHSLETEKEYALASTKSTDGRDTGYVNPIDMDAAKEMDQLSLAYSFYKAYEHATERPFGISDRRFKCNNLSLGTWILRKAGLIDDHPCADPEKYYEFRSLFEQYQTEVLDAQTKKSFNEHFSKLRDDVLKEADVLVATMMNASTVAIHLQFQPDVVIVDECARSTEPEFWYVLGNYVAPFLLFGDEAQLKPFVKSNSQTNCFVKQLAFPLFSRLKSLGLPWSILKMQHRTIKLIADCTNNVFYQGVLVNGPGTDIQDRPYAMAMQAYLAVKFPARPKAPAMVVKVHSTAIRNSNKSYYNLQSASAIMNMVEEILTQKVIPAEAITIMAFYKAQVELLRISVENLQRTKPFLHAELVRVRTVDGMQGSENHLVILDIVATHAIGFLKQKNRVNVATSRARDSMVIFGSITTLWTVDKEERAYLTEVVSHYQDADLYDVVTPAVSPYLPQTYTSVENMQDDEGGDAWESEDGEVQDDDANTEWPTTMQVDNPSEGQSHELSIAWGGETGPPDEDTSTPIEWV